MTLQGPTFRQRSNCWRQKLARRHRHPWLYLEIFALLWAHIIPLPATTRSGTARSRLCYFTRLLGSSKTDAKHHLRSEHLLFLTNLPPRFANGIRETLSGGQQSSPCSGITWAFDFMGRRFLTVNTQPTGTLWLLPCLQQSGNVGITL